MRKWRRMGVGAVIALALLISGCKAHAAIPQSSTPPVAPAWVGTPVQESVPSARTLLGVLPSIRSFSPVHVLLPTNVVLGTPVVLHSFSKNQPSTFWASIEPSATAYVVPVQDPAGQVVAFALLTPRGGGGLSVAALEKPEEFFLPSGAYYPGLARLSQEVRSVLGPRATVTLAIPRAGAAVIGSSGANVAAAWTDASGIGVTRYPGVAESGIVTGTAALRTARTLTQSPFIGF